MAVNDKRSRDHIRQSRPGTRRGGSALEWATCSRGYTLIEAMMALIILTIGVTGVASGLTTVMLASVHTSEQARATALAVQKIEELKALPVSEIQTDASVAVDADGVEGSGPYKRSVEVVRSDGLEIAEVTVEVEYQVGRLGKRRVRLFTMVYTGS